MVLAHKGLDKVMQDFYHQQLLKLVGRIFNGCHLGCQHLDFHSTQNKGPYLKINRCRKGSIVLGTLEVHGSISLACRWELN